jgi:drug/metabolite transporter (DMT)-like permease
LLGELASLSTAFTWAIASLVFARIGKRASPMALNLLKCTAAALLLVPTLLIIEGAPSSIPGGDALRIGATAVFGLALADTLYFQALVRLGARQAAVMISLVPPLTALLAAAIIDEALTLSMVTGMLLTLAGVAIVVLDTSGPASEATTAPERRAGLIAGLGYVLCQAVSNVLLKDVGAALSPLFITTGRLVIGAATLAVALAAMGALTTSVRALAQRDVLGRGLTATVLGTYVGLWLGVYGLRHAKVGVATTLSATTPLFVLLIARVFLGARVGVRAVTGALLASIGVAVRFVFPG